MTLKYFGVLIFFQILKVNAEADKGSVPSKQSAARVIFFGRINFWSKHTLFVANGKTIIQYASPKAVGSKIILGWVIFPGYVTLPRHGNVTQTDVVYPAWVQLPSLGKVTPAG